MNFTKDNLTRFSAMVVYFGHAICSITTVTEDQCTLRNPSKSWILVDDAAFEGSYLFFDTDSGNWIRSSKAVGSEKLSPRAGLLNREKGHQNAAGISGALENNKFYMTFPIAENPNRLSNANYYKDLEQYVGMAFNCDTETEGLTSSTLDESIFFGLKMYWKR